MINKIHESIKSESVWYLTVKLGNICTVPHFKLQYKVVSNYGFLVPFNGLQLYLFLRYNMATPDDEDAAPPVVYFTMYLSRKPSTHVFNILVPSALMFVVSIMVFPLPADSGEKVSLSISILLSYSVLMLRLSDIMPANAESVPVLSKSIVTSWLIYNYGSTEM